MDVLSDVTHACLSPEVVLWQNEFKQSDMTEVGTVTHSDCEDMAPTICRVALPKAWAEYGHSQNMLLNHKRNQHQNFFPPPDMTFS